MKVGAEDKKKLIIAGILSFFAILSAIYLYSLLFGGPSTPPPTPPAAVVVPAPAPATTAKAPAGTVQKVASSSVQLDPTLHMEAMLVTESLVYSGNGRNIFAAGPADEPGPVKNEKANFSPRGPAPPPPGSRAPLVAGPPPINLKFFGTATSQNGKVRRAFLLNGDDVILASVGDVVERRYRIVSITANSILVEDIPNSNKQTLPLMAN